MGHHMAWVRGPTTDFTVLATALAAGGRTVAGACGDGRARLRRT